MAKYLTKKIKDERGIWIPVYGKTPEELDEKVSRRLEEIEAAKALARNPVCLPVRQAVVRHGHKGSQL